MHTIDLSRAQVQQLVDFCVEHKRTTWFIAKDHGAYLGASTGAKPKPQCLFYFPGCDPEKDEDFYDTADTKFGGDDFGEHMPLADLQRYLEKPAMDGIRVKVTSRAITIDVFEKVPVNKPATKIPNAASDKVFYGVRQPNGKVSCIRKTDLHKTLLHIGGGGTPAHIARAEEAAKELQEKGSITVKGFWIGPLSEV
jgi:hypothetical protein